LGTDLGLRSRAPEANEKEQDERKKRIDWVTGTALEEAGAQDLGLGSRTPEAHKEKKRRKKKKKKLKVSGTALEDAGARIWD